ncbi:hypothetical protein LGM65_25920 [Burkholderia anthina]|uniref:hypothetical protein n=1 Tax=Burkholderia anthina TaxID=179879 RepID=UPI001CF5005A|nr:hypothetical protein [Burkholderia anthina]MCA8094276.1 hypothetical protein [Burkholderia anthina]
MHDPPGEHAAQSSQMAFHPAPPGIDLSLHDTASDLTSLGLIESVDDLVDVKDRDIRKTPFVLAIISMLLKQRAAKNRRLDA